MGNDIVCGPAFEALPGRKLEKMKELKAERSKKGFFSVCTGSQTGAKSSIFEHNSASASVSPSSQTFKDLVANGHSSFNKLSSLDHSPVTGTIVNPPPRVSGIQSDLVTEAFSDPSFVLQVRGLEAMLRVRERAVAHPVTGRAAFETDSNDLLSEFGDGGHEASLRSVAAGSGIATNKRDLEMDTGLETAVQRAFLDPEAGVSEVTSRACLEQIKNSQFANWLSGLFLLSSCVIACTRTRFFDRLMSCTPCWCICCGCCCCFTCWFTCSVVCSSCFCCMR